MYVGKGSTKKRLMLDEAMLVPGQTSHLLSLRALDRHGGEVVLVGDACYILSDRDAVYESRLLAKVSVVGKANNLELYALQVTPVKALANVAVTRIAGEAELWHRRFNHLGF